MPSTEQRISIQLSRRLEMEASILEHLETIPPRRRQEWLRGLLAAGFAEHRRVLDAVRGEVPGAHARMAPARSAGTFRRGAFAGWLADRKRPEQAAVPLPSRTRSVAVAPPLEPGRKRFAALQRVIGA